MDESPSPRVDSNSGVDDPCLRMLGFLLWGTNEVWRVDYTRGDVWFGGLFRLVIFYLHFNIQLLRGLIRLQSLPGLVYGAFQGYARAFYAELIPLGEEARWYGLFSITDKVFKISSLCSSYQR